MTFLFSFIALIFASWLLPYILQFRGQRLRGFSKKVYVGIIPGSGYAFACGLFNSKMVFVNANFSHIWNDVEKKIIIEHEIGHCVGYHVEVKTLLNSIKYAVMLQIVALFIPLWLGLIIAVCLFIVDQVTKKMFMPVYYNFEFKADIYAAVKTKFSASIVDFYNKLALNRSSSTHPSVADRQKNMTNFKLK